MVIVHVSYLLLINGCGLQPCESEKTIQSYSGAKRASPFRRTPCPGPVGPRSVPKRTVVGLREWIPSAVALLGPVEFGLGLPPLVELREGVRVPPGILGTRGPSEGRRPPHHSAVRESSRTEGAEPWVLAGPFRFTSSGQNTRITRGEGPRFSAGSQVISRNLFVKSNGGSSIGSGQWSWEWVQYRHVWRRDRANLRYASFGASRHQRS